MKKLILFSCIVISSVTCIHAITADEILDRIDKNYVSENRRAISKMIIKGRRGIRTLRSESWIQGMDKAFTEYLYPLRDKGTKMLKIENELWMYSPSSNRTIKIAGHMLRQSMMGSDISYEDYMEDPVLSNIYDVTLDGEDFFHERECYVLQLTAKKDVAYAKRKMWVDKERFLPLKEERFAKSGKLLKRLTIEEVLKVEDRWYFKRVIFKDMLKKGSGTEFVIEEIEFDIDIPDYLFTKAALRR
jgi:outer membrane lipoprotein-sorting protein